MKKAILALFALMLASASAFAQSSPNLTYGQVPTAGQWNSYFAAKQDYLGYVPVNRGGDTMFGPLKTYAPTGAQAGLIVTPGQVPTAPADGSIWFTGSGMYMRVNGATIGPIANAAVGGPATSVVGHVVLFNNTTGSLLSDSGKATPTGAFVGTTDTQTLTNKSISGAQINSGQVAVANGGTGLASGTSGGVPYYSASATIASSALLTNNALMLGGGAAAAPKVVGSLGTTTTLLHGNAAGAPSFGSLAYADIASGAIASTAQYQSNTASTLLTPNAAWAGAGVTALTDASTIAVDMSTGFNFSVTLTGTPHALGNPTNTKVGQTGAFRVAQDATGSRVLTYGSNYKFAGGTACTLSPGANKIDYIFYFTFSSTEILLNCVLDVH